MSEYNPSIGSPNRRAVSNFDGPEARDLPKSWEQARALFDRADKRRGGARGKVAHNTTVEERRYMRHSGNESSYAVRLHSTDVVTFHPDGSIELNTGGWQTPTTRDRMQRCGVRVSMHLGIPGVRHGNSELPYVDGMMLKFRSDGTPGMAWYRNTSLPSGTLDEIRRRRTRNLSRERRDYKAGREPTRDCFRWPNRSGGWAPRGTAPETFQTDSELGLKPICAKKEAAFARAVSGVQS